MTSATFSVTGLTCGHCVAAVTEELTALPSVSSVTVQLVPSGVSTVAVTSTEPVDPAAVRAALDEAGNYQLA